MDIKQLWDKQVVPLANQNELFRKMKSFKRKRRIKTVILNIVLLLTVCFVAFICIYFEPQLLSTKIGIVLTVVPIAVVSAFNCKIIPLYKQVDESKSNVDYLNDLLVMKSKENLMQTKVMNLYFILLSAGISLCIYEYTLNISLIFGVIAYFAVFLWIGFNWFFLRPGIIKKNRKQTENLINQIEKVKSRVSCEHA